MEFSILREAKLGLDCLRVEIAVEVRTASGQPVRMPFVFDTGSEVSVVSEDIAATLELPAGGRTTGVIGSTARGAGRVVPVRFRFAAVPDLTIDSEWVVMSGVTEMRLLALRDILPHFEIRTLNMNLYFVRK